MAIKTEKSTAKHRGNRPRLPDRYFEQIVEQAGRERLPISIIFHKWLEVAEEHFQKIYSKEKEQKSSK